MQLSHEELIHAVVASAASRLPAKDKATLDHAKFVYGAGKPHLRGVTYYDRWKVGDATWPLIEVCAMGEETPCQLIGTTLHEIGHVLAGYGAGHGPEWKATCDRLGLRQAKAAGTSYYWSRLATELRHQFHDVELIDGAPSNGVVLPRTVTRTGPRPCTAVIGVRGGKSRGPGSGSRLIKVACACGYTARVSRRWLNVGAPICPTCRVSMAES